MILKPVFSSFSFNSLAITENAVSQDNSAAEGVEGDATLAPAAGTLHSLNINFSVTGGGYDTFKDLLLNFEKHVRLLDVNSISFSSPDEEGSYTLSLTTYYYAENSNQQ